MTHHPQLDLTPPPNAKPSDQQEQTSPPISQSDRSDPTRGMQGEDYNYGGASSSSMSKVKSDNSDEKVGAPVEKSGPTPRAQTPPGNHSSTEANWGNRSGTGMGGGISAVEETGKKAQESKDKK